MITVQNGGEGEWYLSTETSGKATFSYTDASFGAPTPRTSDDSISVSGSVTIDEKGAPVLEMSDY